MCLKAVAAGEPVKEWGNLRMAILDAVSTHIEKDFVEKDQFTDPLTDTVQTVADLHTKLSRILYTFDDPPFTVQRLAELAELGDERSQYGPEDIYKYLLALLRLVSVRSTTTRFDMYSNFETSKEDTDRRGVFLDDIDWASSIDPSELDIGEDEGHMSAILD